MPLKIIFFNIKNYEFLLKKNKKITFTQTSKLKKIANNRRQKLQDTFYY